MRNKSAVRRTLLALTGLVLVAAFAYAGYWEYVAGVLRDQLEPWAQARAAEGYLLRWDGAAVAGFPGSFRFDFTNLSFGTVRPLPVALEAATVSASAMPWNLRHWEFAAPSGARLTGPSGTAGFDVRRLAGAVDINERAVAAVDLTAVGLAGIGLALGIKVADAEAHIELPATPPQSHTDTALGLSLQVDQASLPVAVPGFGNTLSGFSVAGQIKGVLPPGPFVTALSQWRDSGGTVELQSLRLRWGSLSLDASGTLALDGALQPEGAFSATIAGQDAAVDVAVMTGALKPDQAGAAKTVLGLLAHPVPNGSDQDGEKAISLPLTIENQRLFLGPAKIATIPTISWK